MQATLLNYGGQHGYGRCSIASQGSLEEDECDSSEELIGSASGGGQSEPHALGAHQPKLAPISGCLGPTTVFRLQFLGSVEVEEEGGRKRRKRLKNHMVEEAVTKIKVRLHCPLHVLPRLNHPSLCNNVMCPSTTDCPLTLERTVVRQRLTTHSSAFYHPPPY